MADEVEECHESGNPTWSDDTDGTNTPLTADALENIENFIDSLNTTVKKKQTAGGNIEFSGESKGTSGATVSHGGYMDFHYAKSTADYTSRIIEDASGYVNVTPNLKIGGNTVNDFIIASSVTTADNTWSWVKFKSGWAICWARKLDGTVAAGNYGEYGLSFPFTFTQWPILVTSGSLDSTRETDMRYSRSSDTSTDVYVYNAGTSSARWLCEMVAIGKWK